MATLAQTAHRWAQDNDADRMLTNHSLPTRRASFANLIAGTPSVAPAVAGVDRGVHTLRGSSLIFSHGLHFPIAAHHTVLDAEGRYSRVTLLTTQSYSASTTNHIRTVRGALRTNYVLCRHVQGVSAYFGSQTFTSLESFHAANLRNFAQNAMSFQISAERRCSVGRRDYDLSQAGQEIARLRSYCAVMRIPVPDGDVGEMIAAFDAQYQRERIERQRLEDLRIAALVAERARSREESTADFLAWQAGADGVRCPATWHADADGCAYIRRSPDGSRLQTSQGADVPWSHAVRAFHFVKGLRDAGRTWHRLQSAGGESASRVGHFTIDHVSVDGSFRAGCHSFSWAEIERLARAENVFESAEESV